MLHIGYYYSDYGLFDLYKMDGLNPNWVTNICYYDSYNKKYFSPNMKNLIANGRDLNGAHFNEQLLSRDIRYTHSSFVLL